MACLGRKWTTMRRSATSFGKERCGFKFDWTQVQPTGVPVAYNALFELFGATRFSPFSGLGGSHNSTSTSTYVSCFSLACCCGNLLWCNINSATNLVPQDEKSSICNRTVAPFPFSGRSKLLAIKITRLTYARSCSVVDQSTCVQFCFLLDQA